jgi:1-deoxy-D-xylulose-5-phosphate synthase
MSLLKKINGPDDLKKLNRDELPELAQEIRNEILKVVSSNGGHLSSNLGVVELSIVLHYLFDTPNDKIVWDTSNQTYTHKLLTGRRENFHTLRQFGGISGFAKREESIYDTFNAGHSGTGISAGAGIAAARDHNRQDHKVIVVVGDGALTAGMAFEGLNQAGALSQDLIVILNDNEMSISKNVGAISSYLSRIMTGKFYTRVKEEAKTILKSIPKLGEPILELVMRAEESAKGLIVPGLLFEELGFLYVGPIDGQRFDHLIPTLENVKKLKGPILVHVLTKKGKGYEPAEKDPVFFHIAPPFQLETGKVRKKATLPTYTQVFADSLIELAKEDRRIIAITAAMAEGTGLAKFAKAIPERFYDVGIAEQHAVTFAAGLASEGYRPVTAIYSTFLQRAFDQIVHDVAVQNLPVTFAIDRGGLVAEDGTTHHGALDLSYLRHIPNMVVMAPKDENELRHMLKTAIHRDGPTALRYSRGNALGISLDPGIRTLDIGKGEILMEGEDLAIIAVGYGVAPALQAAKQLEKEGIFATVVNARFVKPLDRELITTIVRKVKNVLTVEENVLMGGFGSAVLECIADEGLLGDLSVKRIGLPDEFVGQGPQEILRQKHGITTENILEQAKALLKVNGRRKVKDLTAAVRR